jgi:hypothetical protein
MAARVSASFLTGKKPGLFPRSPAEQRTFEGVVFDSKLEMQRWATLRQREKAGLICDLTYHPVYKVSINGFHFCSYEADAKYRDPETGDWTIEDTKSSGTARDPAFRLRKKATELFFGIIVNVVTK